MAFDATGKTNAGALPGRPRNQASTGSASSSNCCGIVPIAGALYAAYRGISALNKKPDQPDIPRVEPKSQAAQWRTVTRVVDEHNRTDTRWLDYELDAAKLLGVSRDTLRYRLERLELRDKVDD